MKIQLQDASAKVYDVEAPDGTPVDAIESQAAKELGREVRMVDRPSKTEYGLDSFKRGFSGMAKFVGSVADAPAHAMNLINRGINATLGKIGFPEQSTEIPARLGDLAGKGWDMMTGVRNVPPPSEVSKYLVGKPAEFLGGSVGPSGALIAKSVRPGLTAATEALSGYAGGVGMAGGEDVGGALGKGVARVVGGDKNTGEDWGRVLGGTLGALGVGGGTAMVAPKAVDATVRGVRNTIIPKLTDTAEHEALLGSAFTKHFRESLLADPRWKANIEETLKTKDAINRWITTGKGPDGVMFEPDLSMATGTKPMRAMQQVAEMESAAASAKGVESRSRVDEALRSYRDGNFPAGQKTVQELSAEELAGLEAQVSARQSQLDADMEKLRSRVRTGQFGPDEGVALEQLKKEQEKAATAKTDVQYAQVYKLADQLGFGGSLDPLAAYIGRYMRDQKTIAQDTPSFMTTILKAVREGSAMTRSKTVKDAFGADALPESAAQFVARQGGLNKDLIAGDGLVDVGRAPGWAMKGKDGKTNFWLVHKGEGAKSPDHMRELMVESGHLPQGASIDDMYRAVEKEVADGPTYFAQRDWDRAAEIMAARKQQMELEMGGSEVPFKTDARYPASFAVSHSIVKRLREEMRDLSKRPNTDEYRQQIGLLKDMEKIVLQQIDAAGPSVGGKLNEADAFFKQTVADPFYRGAAASTFNNRGLIEDVGQRLMSKGEEGARNFKQVFGDSERAADLLWNATLDSMARRIGEKTVTPERVRAFYEDHRKFLDQFPVIRARIFAVDQVAEGMQQRSAQIAADTRAVNRDLVATLTNTTDVEGALMGALGNEARMRQVAGWAQRSPQLGQEIARTYVEALEKSGNPLEIIAQSGAGLKPVFDALGPKHWENLQLLMRGRTIQARGAPDPILKPETITDPVQALLGTGTSGVFSRIRGAVYRQISPGYVIADLGGKYYFRVEREKARELINQALYDPKIAENVLALEKQLELPKPDFQKIRDVMEDLKVHYNIHGLRVGVGAFNMASEDSADRRSRESGEKAMQREWSQRR